MGRSPCCATHSVLNRGPWTAQENLILGNYISIHGEGRWKALPKNAGLNRCGKSCRLRWLNYLRPDIKRGNISPDEEELIIRMHKLLGNRWSLIAGRLPGRTDNEIKNYWNTHLSKTRVPEKETIPQPHTPHTKSKRGPIEGRIAKRRKIYVDSGDADHQALRSSDVTEEVKASKSCCDIVNPAITENICDSMENIYELNVDGGPFQQSQQYSENEEGTSHLLKENLSCWESMESNYELKIDNCPLKHSLHYSENNYELSVDDGLFQHSQNYSEKEVGKSHALKENLSCCECDMVFSPCNDFILKEFVQRPSDEFEQMCSLESLWQGGAMSDEW